MKIKIKILLSLLSLVIGCSSLTVRGRKEAEVGSIIKVDDNDYDAYERKTSFIESVKHSYGDKGQFIHFEDGIAHIESEENLKTSSEFVKEGLKTFNKIYECYKPFSDHRTLSYQLKAKFKTQGRSVSCKERVKFENTTLSKILYAFNDPNNQERCADNIPFIQTQKLFTKKCLPEKQTYYLSTESCFTVDEYINKKEFIDRKSRLHIVLKGKLNIALYSDSRFCLGRQIVYTSGEGYFYKGKMMPTINVYGYIKYSDENGLDYCKIKNRDDTGYEPRLVTGTCK